jgi:hypothetical protein
MVGDFDSDGVCDVPSCTATRRSRKIVAFGLHPDDPVEITDPYRHTPATRSCACDVMDAVKPRPDGVPTPR